LLSVNIATFPLRGYGTYPAGIATGAGTDTNLWFTLVNNGGNIGMINPNDPAAVVKQYATPTSGSGPGPIAAGPDGNYWFFEEGADQFGFFSPSNPGNITEIPLLTTANPQVEAITTGPNGTLWFTEANADQVGVINTSSHQITEIPVPTSGAKP
jgi:virginiamycin B lyase